MKKVTFVYEDAKSADCDEDQELVIKNLLGPEEDSLCGIGVCRQNKHLQKLARPVTYLVVSSVIALIQGLFFTYSNATLSTIEKQFGLPSKLSGLTTTGNDVILLLLSLPLPFLAGRGHRPRWLAFSMFLSAFGCLIAVSPHFWFESSRNSAFAMNATIDLDTKRTTTMIIDSNSCNDLSQKCKNASAETSSADSTPKHYSSFGIVAIFSVAQMFAGVASLLYYTIGYSYMDEAVPKEKVPIFLSISGGMRLLGPVCGYSLAAWALGMWVDPSETDVPIEPSHPHWIGAWWLGYVVIGLLLLSFSWMLVLLPRTLPSTRRRKHKELSQLALRNPDEFVQLSQSFRPARNTDWKEMGPSLKRIFSSKIYRLVLLNQVLFWFAFFGYITFKSKYLEHQFKLSAAEANRYIATVSLIAALIGWVGTGAILSFLRPRTKSVIIYMAILSCASCLCHLIQLSIFCDHSTISGLEDFQSSKLETTQEKLPTNIGSCHENCGCHGKQFSPVCLSNSSTTYINPCSAYCSSNSTPKVLETFVPTYSSGFCIPMCSSFTLYLTISVLAKMAQAASRVPVNLILFRSIEERDKDLCLGVFNAAIALFASIPAPIIFGWALDYTCILWKVSCSGESLQCWLYDIDTFRKIIHGLPSVFLALCFITDLLLLGHHGKLILYPQRKQEEEVS